jgi:hypothetical protein
MDLIWRKHNKPNIIIREKKTKIQKQTRGHECMQPFLKADQLHRSSSNPTLINATQSLSKGKTCNNLLFP